MIPACLTLSNIRYVSRVKWNNPWKGVAPSPTPRCNIYWKGSLLVALDYGRQLYLLTHNSTSALIIYPTSDQGVFDRRSFQCGEPHKNWDLCAAITKMIDHIGIFRLSCLRRQAMNSAQQSGYFPGECLPETRRVRRNAQYHPPRARQWRWHFAFVWRRKLDRSRRLLSNSAPNLQEEWLNLKKFITQVTKAMFEKKNFFPLYLAMCNKVLLFSSKEWEKKFFLRFLVK